MKKVCYISFSSNPHGKNLINSLAKQIFHLVEAIANFPNEIGTGEFSSSHFQLQKKNENKINTDSNDNSRLT